MGCGTSKKTSADDPASPRSEKTSPSRNKGYESPPKGKYVVNGSTVNGGSTRSDSVFSESTDKGFKRRLRENLRAATAGTDTDELQKAMDRFTAARLEDCGDLSRARDRMELLKLKKDLRDGIMRSNVGVLEKTIYLAEKSKFSGQLHGQIEAAKRKLQHLRELNEYKHKILSMEQTTISEIHSYHNPPPCVHDVMAATYILLGTPEPKLTEWADIQFRLCRVGRDSLIHEIREFDSAKVDDQTRNRVQDILSPHELHTIRQASNGAAAFYVWSTQICDKVGRDKEEEENRLRQQEMEKQKEEERQSRASAKSNGKNKARKPKG